MRTRSCMVFTSKRCKKNIVLKIITIYPLNTRWIQNNNKNYFSPISLMHPYIASIMTAHIWHISSHNRWQTKHTWTRQEEYKWAQITINPLHENNEEPNSHSNIIILLILIQLKLEIYFLVFRQGLTEVWSWEMGMGNKLQTE